MITGRGRFNIYFLLALALTQGGCLGGKTPEEKAKAEKAKQTSTMDLHMEGRADSMDFTEKVLIFREHPVPINVDKQAFLSEANITEAKVIDAPGGGYMLEIHFDRRGTWLLEEVTATNPGKNFAIHSQFGPKLVESRWIAAPIIRKRISNGVLVFTPDASREECDMIADGLNAVAAKVKANAKWW